MHIVSILIILLKIKEINKNIYICVYTYIGDFDLFSSLYS